MSKKKKDKKSEGPGVDLLDREKEKQKLQPPSKYQVVFYNDDYTPMDFVVIVLLDVFHQSFFCVTFSQLYLEKSMLADEG